MTWTNRERKLLALLVVSVVLLISTVIYAVMDVPDEEDPSVPLPLVPEDGNVAHGQQSDEGGSTEGPISKQQPKHDPTESTELIVDVKGAVKNPGIYRLAGDSRVNDAIQAAGGVKKDADTDQLNLAAFLADGMAIIVPAVGEDTNTASPLEGGMMTSATGTNDGKININRASEVELETLSGIGPTRAASIVQNRETNGPFTSVDSLTRVSGIGPKTLENIREQITVK